MQARDSSRWAGRSSRAGVKQRMRRVFAPILLRHCRGRVAMFHIGRSGSTVLGDMMARHPSVFWDGEIYAPLLAKREQLMHSRSLPGRLTTVRLDLRGEISAAVRWGGTRWYGFEVKFFHIERGGFTLPEYIGMLREMGFHRFIVLKRKNYLRKVVSSLLARDTGQWHVTAAGELPASRQVRINPDRVDIDGRTASLLDHFAGFDQGFGMLQAILTRDETLHLTYEDHVEQDPSNGYHLMLGHLDLPVVDASVGYKRINARPLAELVENLDEVRQCIVGTRYAWMVGEER